MQINQDSTAFHEAHCVNWEIQLAMAKDDWARGIKECLGNVVWRRTVGEVILILI
jgi:hypothetical protein